MSETRKDKIETLLQQIREAALAEGDEAAIFIQDLQNEIEYLPGADVGFAKRNISWLVKYGYLEDRPEMTDLEKQAALNSAAADYGDNSATQDAITDVMDEVLDRVAPQQDTEDDVEP